MKKVLFITFLLLNTALAVMAQSYYTVKNIGIKEGLSNGFALDMVIDNQGFVWVSTEWGVNRIAGNKSTVFNTSNSSISNNEQDGLFFHPKSNTIWIHNKGGKVDVFDCKTQRFTHFSIKGSCNTNVADINMAGDSAIWLADYNGGVTHYDPITKKYTFIEKKQMPKILNGIRSITDDGKGNLYIGLRMDGLIIYNTHTRRSRFFKNNPKDPQSLPGNNVRSVYIDHLQNIWIGTNKGLALFDPVKGKFRVFRHNNNDIHSLAGDNIQQIIESKSNILLIASDVGGISKLDLNKYSHPQEGTVNFEQMTKENCGLTSNNVRRVQEDRFGNIWVAHYNSGIDFIPYQQSNFYTLRYLGQPISNISSFYVDTKENQMWIGQDDNITLYASGTVQKTWNFSSSITNSSSYVYTLRSDHNGNVWIGTADNGLLLLDRATNTFRHIECTGALDINAIYVDQDNKVWVGTESGIVTIYNKVATEETGITRIIGSSAIPFAINEDDHHNIWIGTLSGGIYIISPNKKLIAHLHKGNGFPSNSVNQIYKDEEGSMWVATYKGLVYISYPENPGKYEIYNEKQGIKESHIRSIVQDRQGNIWVSMFSGIAYFDRKKKKFYNYDYQSGIPTSNFLVGAAGISYEGTLSFGSSAGICYFNPQMLIEPKETPVVEIIDCERLESQSADGKFINSIIPTDEEGIIHLKYDENTFKITFTSANFAEEANVEYSYLMKGLDDKWYETEGDNEVTFRNLSPGEYTFRVRAKLKNQDWENAKVAEMKVIIDPPLWLTWWAKLIYALIMGSIIFYFVRSYQKELKLRSSLDKTRWEALQKQELNEERLRFFTNITHELRTPLTLIMGPLEDLMEDVRLPEVLSRKVKSIHASSERLLNLINEILEFRKTETQNRRLTVAHDDLKALVQEIGNRFKDLNRNQNVAFNISVPQHPVDIYFDSEVITTILNNLISNAIKYTPKGCITLSLNCVNSTTNNSKQGNVQSKVIISVKDTGYGISKKALPHIYDRFYQAKGLHQASGTGIGLALVKSLADLHEADLKVESEEGKGSVFSFVLDAENTYPDALHKEDAPVEEGSKDLLEQEDINEQEEEQADARPLILVVEDNDDIRQYIEESLSEDYRIIQARNGKEGCDQAFSEIPSLIVSDIMMPEMDGIEMMKILKNDIRTSHIPIILLTAKTSPLDQEEGYDSGADSYLMKPFSAKLLQSRIRNILSGRHRLAEFIIQHNMPSAAGMGTLTSIAAEASGQQSKEEAELAASIPELGPLDKKFMEKLNRLIEENMTTEDIDIAFMTDKMAMSHSSFYRKVKALTGVSANEYIRKIKLQRSMQLLQSGEYNVTEAAMMTGFNNIGYFRKCFKKEYGVSPSEVLKGKG